MQTDRHTDRQTDMTKLIVAILRTRLKRLDISRAERDSDRDSELNIRK